MSHYTIGSQWLNFVAFPYAPILSLHNPYCNGHTESQSYPTMIRLCPKLLGLMKSTVRHLISPAEGQSAQWLHSHNCQIQYYFSSYVDWRSNSCRANMRPSSLEDVITTVKTPALEMELNSPFPVYIIHLDHLQIFQLNDMFHAWTLLQWLFLGFSSNAIELWNLDRRYHTSVSIQDCIDRLLAHIRIWIYARYHALMFFDLNSIRIFPLGKRKCSVANCYHGSPEWCVALTKAPRLLCGIWGFWKTYLS
jgi:hypothetical protein